MLWKNYVGCGCGRGLLNDAIVWCRPRTILRLRAHGGLDLGGANIRIYNDTIY
jgi:hypothetical protein